MLIVATARLSEVHACQATEIYRPFQVDVYCSKITCRLLSDTFERQFWAHYVALLAKPSVGNGMVDSAEGLERCVKEGKVVGIGGHVAVDEFDLCTIRVQFLLKGDGRLIEHVSKEDVSLGLV